MAYEIQLHVRICGKLGMAMVANKVVQKKIRPSSNFKNGMSLRNQKVFFIFLISKCYFSSMLQKVRCIPSVGTMCRCEKMPFRYEGCSTLVNPFPIFQESNAGHPRPEADWIFLVVICCSADELMVIGQRSAFNFILKENNKKGLLHLYQT